MERPTSVTVFGVLNIVFSVLGFFALLGTMVMFTAVAGANNPVVKLIQENPGYATWMKICIVFGLIVTPALLAAGIGLIMLKPWARIVSIVYAIYTLVSGLIGGVINYFLLIQPLMQQAQEQQGPAAAGAMGGAIGGMIGGFAGLIYPALLLYFMFRPNVKEAFLPPPIPPPIPQA